MKATYRIILTILSVATGGVFLYSAYTKVVPIQAFEYSLSEFTHIPAVMAAVTARFFISIEAGLGALLVLHLYGKSKWPLKGALILLAVFTLYLVWLWIVAGNNVNCGCFGDAIWMNPSTSLIKNVVMMAVIAVLIKYHNGFTYLWARVTGPLLLVTAFALSYILFPVFTRYKIDLAAIYNDKQFAPATDLGKGKHVVAFLSPSCGYCRKAALKMHDMKARDTTLPFFLIIGGTTSSLKDFWAASHAEDLPHTRLAQGPFLKYTHNIFPVILWINNGWVEADVNYPDLNQAVIEKWMK